MTLNTIIENFGTLIGVVYIYYQYKASPKFWYVSVVNAIPFIYLFFAKGNYASGLLFTYYLIVALQNIFFARKGEEQGDVFVIRNIPRALYPRLFGVAALIFAAIYAFLLNTESIKQLLETVFGMSLPFAVPQTPAADAFATALSFLAMWLLSKKYLEQWLIWVVVNSAFVYMQLVAGLYLWAGLFFLYLVVAVMGYFNWRKLQRRQCAEA